MIDPQIAAISLKQDRILSVLEAHTARFNSLDLSLAMILTALREEQMAALGTIIEMQRKLLEAASGDGSGRELANALKRLAESVEANTKVVAELPARVEESVKLATGGWIDLPDHPTGH